MFHRIKFSAVPMGSVDKKDQTLFRQMLPLMATRLVLPPTGVIHRTIRLSMAPSARRIIRTLLIGGNR